jgi:N-acetylglucosamine-6-phosphate deacetylase
VKTAYLARKLFTPTETIDHPILLVEDGIITKIASQTEAEIPSNHQITDFGEHILAPAYFDQHIHGSANHDVMEATQPALNAINRFLARHGVAAYLATTVTAPLDVTLASLSGLAKIIANPTPQPGEAKPVGIHLEGPFLSHEKRGVHNPELLLTPTIALFDRFWQAAEGHIKLLTIAPELPNALEVIAHATSLGVRVSLGHTNATAAQALSGIAAGATSATHTFNAMRNFSQREPGILGVVLDDQNLYAEIIADGYHVDAIAVRLYWKAKGPSRAILITDGISATGMPDGHYKLGNLDVEVKEGKCTSGGSIAGSTLTLDKAVSNFHQFTKASLHEVVGLAARNPARMLGLDDQFGALALGRSADLVVLDQDGVLKETVIGEIHGALPARLRRDSR